MKAPDVYFDQQTGALAGQNHFLALKQVFPSLSVFFHHKNKKMQKKKQMIWTSKRRAEHLFISRNTQHAALELTDITNVLSL